MALAIELESLANFYVNALKAPVKCNVDKIQQNFKRALDQGYKNMNTHRSYWKVILANIAIAATGIGLLLIARKYYRTGSSFFEETKRQQKVHQIKELVDEVEKWSNLKVG